jgi:hypothetical protein
MLGGYCTGTENTASSSRIHFDDFPPRGNTATEAREGVGVQGGRSGRKTRKVMPLQARSSGADFPLLEPPRVLH